MVSGINLFEAPDRESLVGGHVAILSLEQHPGLYQRALIECGVIDGVGLAEFYIAARAAAEFLRWRSSESVTAP